MMVYFPLGMMIAYTVMAILGVGTWGDTEPWMTVVMFGCVVLLTWVSGWLFGMEQANRRRSR